MSSRRQSHTTPPPTWRSLATPRKAAPSPSVSVVFAQPEQVSPSAGSQHSTGSTNRKRELVDSSRQRGMKDVFGSVPSQNKPSERPRTDSIASLRAMTVSATTLQDSDRGSIISFGRKSSKQSLKSVSPARANTTDVPDLSESPTNASEATLALQPPNELSIPPCGEITAVVAPLDPLSAGQQLPTLDLSARSQKSPSNTSYVTLSGESRVSQEPPNAPVVAPPRPLMECSTSSSLLKTHPDSSDVFAEDSAGLSSSVLTVKPKTSQLPSSRTSGWFGSRSRGRAEAPDQQHTASVVHVSGRVPPQEVSVLAASNVSPSVSLVPSPTKSTRSWFKSRPHAETNKESGRQSVALPEHSITPPQTAPPRDNGSTVATAVTEINAGHSNVSRDLLSLTPAPLPPVSNPEVNPPVVSGVGLEPTSVLSKQTDNSEKPEPQPLAVTPALKLKAAPPPVVKSGGWFGSRSSVASAPSANMQSPESAAPTVSTMTLPLEPQTEASATAVPTVNVEDVSPVALQAVASSIAAPLPVPHASTPTQPLASSGWFGARTRVEIIMPPPPTLNQQEALALPTPSLPSISSELQSPPAPAPTLASSQVTLLKSSQPISVQAAPRRSLWFSPQSPPRPNGSQRVPSVPSSVDDEVRIRGSDTPPRSPPAVLVSNQAPGGKLSSLNPSTSRFTLSLPLLGRPKVPLEVLLQSDGETSKEKDFPPVVDLSVRPVNVTPGLLSGSHESTINVAAEFPPNHPIKATPEISVDKAPAPASPWWDYVGLGSSGRQADTERAEDNLTPTGPGAGPPPVTQDIPAALAQPIVEALLESNQIQPAPASSPAAASIKSNETTKTVTSTWYNPLAWWYSQPLPEIVPEEVTAKTEAELVKEEALARPDPQLISAPLAVLPPGMLEPVNPILSTLATNSKGWTSFFSSRALATKAITERGEDGGMEVMDLDDETDDTRPVTPIPSCSSPDTSSPTRGRAWSVKNSNGADPKRKPAPVPLTNSENIKRKVADPKRTASPASSKKSVPPPTPRLPNLVLPTFHDTFHTLPRSQPPPTARAMATSTLKKTLGYVSGILFADSQSGTCDAKGKGKQIEKGFETFGQELPRAWEIFGDDRGLHVAKPCRKVVVIGIHGWFPGAAVRTVLGEPTGTSAKFANMMSTAVEIFAEKHGMQFEQITKIPLEGEGKIEQRVQKLYQNLSSNAEWMQALRNSDVILVATHSQGSIVSTHLINRLIRDGHIRTLRNFDVAASAAAFLASGGVVGAVGRQHVCCLSLCGIHLGPLAYLHKSSLVQPYIQYFESAAASELFEFQHTESQVSKDYVRALNHVLDHGVKIVYIASLNDQVVPIYSGAFTSASHPLILRALYIDGDAYNSSDFLSNLLVLLLRIRNVGLSDGGLLAHLSEATAGSLSGVGHSTAYEEIACFSLAVDYLFKVNDGLDSSSDFIFEPFNARSALNDYEIPWALRDVIADERVVYLFSQEFATLRDAFDDWQPRTTILRDLKRKLEPIRRLKLTSRL